MIGRTNAGSGKKSLILPTNPDISIKSDDTQLTLLWTQPESEVEIDHYNIYTSLSEPSSLKDMELVESVGTKIPEGTNILDATIYTSNSLSSVQTVPYTDSNSGVTVNKVGDTISFGAVTGSALTIYMKSPLNDVYGTFRMSGCPSGGSSGACLRFNYKENGSSASTLVRDTGDGLEIDTTNKVFYDCLELYVDANGYPNLSTNEFTPKIEPINGYYKNLSYTITNLTNDQTYYVGIQAVSVEGYENASMWKVQNGVPYYLKFVTVGNSGNSYYSTDGLKWTAMSGLNTSNYYQSVTYGNDRFVCVGEKCLSYYSTNGKTWIAMSGLDTSNHYYDVTYGDGRFVCVGDSGKTYYSTDGTSWVAINGLDTSKHFRGVTNNKWRDAA